MNLKGQQFGRWTILGPTEKRGNATYCLCRCDCGTEKFVNQGNLRSGCTKSCGCLRREVLRELRTTHGKSGTPEYSTWLRMKQRCYDENATRYEYWGGRGIRVCSHWQGSFENFLADMGKVPGPGYSLERIDNDRDYAPDNCYWATPKEQSRNTRHNRFLEHDGKTLCVAEWVEITGIKSTTIRERIDSRGWSVEKALTTPVRR